MKKDFASDHFDAIWAVDWSGAKGRYHGVAVARLSSQGRRRPGVAEMVPAPGGGVWTRTAVVERVAREIQAGRRLLVGFDFAFSFPCSVLTGWRIGPRASMRDVWAHVEAGSAGAADFYAGPFVEAAAPDQFWRRGPRPDGWNGDLRMVDHAAWRRAGVRPESVTKLIGPKQVGLGALAGMRALLALKRDVGPGLVVWPEAEIGDGSVIVEIFPTLFRRQALGRIDKIRDGVALSRALAAFGMQAAEGSGDGALSDDATDALVSVAGLRQYSRQPDAFALPRDRRARREGWIFGVPH